MPTIREVQMPGAASHILVRGKVLHLPHDDYEQVVVVPAETQVAGLVLEQSHSCYLAESLDDVEDDKDQVEPVQRLVPLALGLSILVVEKCEEDGIAEDQEEDEGFPVSKAS